MSVCRYSCLSHPACNAHASYYIVIYGLSSSLQMLFRGGGTEHKMRVFIFCKTSVRNISNSKKNSANYYHKCTYAFPYVLLSDFNETRILKTDSRKPFTCQISFLKICSLRAKMFQEDRQA